QHLPTFDLTLATPTERGTLRVGIHQHGVLAVAGVKAGQVGGNRGLADATLGAGNEDAEHGPLRQCPAHHCSRLRRVAAITLVPWKPAQIPLPATSLPRYRA